MFPKSTLKKDPKSQKDLQIIMKKLTKNPKIKNTTKCNINEIFLTHFPSAEKLRISINAIITLAAWLNNWKWLQRARNSRVGRMYGLGDGYLQSDRQTLHARKSWASWTDLLLVIPWSQPSWWHKPYYISSSMVSLIWWCLVRMSRIELRSWSWETLYVVVISPTPSNEPNPAIRTLNP